MSGFQGHRPTCQTSYPLILLAGAEKTGKSYSVAELSGSDLIGETFWIEFGENTAEEYGQVPGARYIVADHDGTFNDVCRRAREAVAEPPVNGKPNLIVIDSVSPIWELLSEEMQQVANRRKKADIDAESKITSDLWNVAKERWKKLIRILKTHNGPVVLVARLEVVAVMDAGGQPTKDKTRKVQAHKSLPFAVDVIVQIPEYRKYQITGVRSLVFNMPPGETFDAPPDFTLDSLLRRMGLAELGVAEPRQFVEPVPSARDAMADVGGTGDDRPVQRHRGPVEDEWNGGPGRSPEATREQLGDLAKGLRIVRGISDEADMLAAVSTLAGRQITAPEQLTRVDAERALSALRSEDEARRAAQPAPAGPEAPAAEAKPAMASGAQLTALNAALGGIGITERNARITWAAEQVSRQLGSTKDLTRAEASRLIDALPKGGSESPGLTDALAGQIRTAETSEALADLSEHMWKHHEAGGLSDAEASKLTDISMARESELAQARKAAA